MLIWYNFKYFYPVFLSNEIASVNLVKFCDLKNEIEYVKPFGVPSILSFTSWEILILLWLITV